MLDDALLELANRHHLDPEVVADLVALLDGADELSSSPARGPRPTRLLGQGGTAEVWEAEDPELQRPVAMKVLRAEVAAHPTMRARFLREARATAQLVHPSIVPIHAVGELPDGRPYFTMAVVRGRTLDEVAARTGADDAALRRLIGVFRRAVDAVAYAHDRGVLHRDLKPTNIMVGRFNTVFVLDWGLVFANDATTEGVAPLPALIEGGTRQGAIHGTPGFMSPEQARGAPLSPASDVYALGVVLRDLLPEPAPEALLEMVARATADDPADRYPQAGDLSEALGRWVDGELQREQALAQVDTARGMLDEERRIRAAAEPTRDEAQTALEKLPGWAPPDERAPHWRALDEAQERLDEADDLRLQRLQVLNGALTLDPQCPEARRALAEHWHEMHAEAEAHGDTKLAREAAAQLAFHDPGIYRTYLEGAGSIRLQSQPDGVAATLSRFEERDRVLVPVDPQDVGRTPLELEDVPMGSYLVELQTDPPVRVPVWIPRNHAWTAPPVPILRAEALGPDDRYVPPGPFWMGARSASLRSEPGRFESVGPLVVRRFPVTQREYIAFLNDLVERGDEQAALRWAPRERGVRPDQPGDVCYGRDADGRFVLAPDAEGDVWDPEYPVFLVDFHGAQAYAAWLASRTGRPWRLPTEREWEKAARGTDARRYPWGDRLADSFACVRGSRPGRPLPARVGEFPVDCSVYGVCGMSGNVREWCTDPYTRAGAQADDAEKVVRGGCWFFPATGGRTTSRYPLAPSNRADTIGFRLVRDLVPEDLHVEPSSR